MCNDLPVVQRSQAKPALPEAKLPIKPPVHTMKVATPQIDSPDPIHCLLHKVHSQPAHLLSVVTQIGSCTIKYHVSTEVLGRMAWSQLQGHAHTNKMHTPNACRVVRSQLATHKPGRAD